MEWMIERHIHCRRCKQLIGIVPEGKGYAEALLRDIVKCPRCGRKLDSSTKSEYHHELYWMFMFILWKLTHPWKLFK